MSGFQVGRKDELDDLGGHPDELGGLGLGGFGFANAAAVGAHFLGGLDDLGLVVELL